MSDTEEIQVSIPKEQLQAFKRMAEVKQVTMSEVIQGFINDLVRYDEGAGNDEHLRIWEWFHRRSF
jgi:metal-responsive CopG/Arc/MetJ family transcriptional regulator